MIISLKSFNSSIISHSDSFENSAASQKRIQFLCLCEKVSLSRVFQCGGNHEIYIIKQRTATKKSVFDCFYVFNVIILILSLVFVNLSITSVFSVLGTMYNRLYNIFLMC